MDNKAREQYLASQPVVPRPERVEPEPWDGLNTVEITVLVIIGAMVIYAIYHIFKDFRKPPK